MSQATVYNLLKKNKKRWLSTKQIAKQMKTSSAASVISLRKLYNQGLVRKKVIIHRFGSYQWKYLK